MTRNTLKHVLKQFDHHKGRNLGHDYFKSGTKTQKVHFSISQNMFMFCGYIEVFNYMKYTKTCDKAVLHHTRITIQVNIKSCPLKCE